VHKCLALCAMHALLALRWLLTMHSQLDLCNAYGNADGVKLNASMWDMSGVNEHIRPSSYLQVMKSTTIWWFCSCKIVKPSWQFPSLKLPNHLQLDSSVILWLRNRLDSFVANVEQSWKLYPASRHFWNSPTLQSEYKNNEVKKINVDTKMTHIYHNNYRA